jgi:predicted TIM-barrel fold metal-dependent hydrolase
MNRIDCHCHIFNIVTVGWRIILEQLSDVVSPGKRGISERGIIDQVGKIAGLIKAFTADSEHIFGQLDKEYKKKYKLFALMFDGDFLLDASANRQLRKINRQIRNSFATENRTERGVEIHSGTRNEIRVKDEDTQLILDFLDELFPEKVTREVRGISKDGFTVQYEQIQQMADNPMLKDRLIPFLGVDPRREDIKSYLNQVGKGKLFAGIKVYPPNGFSPYDKELVGPGSVFEYCSRNGIPVISHCSYGGFATPVKSFHVNGLIIPEGQNDPVEYHGKYNFKKGIKDGFTVMVKERAAVLNHPKIWEEVLKKYNDLILVLAHFGVGNDEWQDEILRMMYKYENLYTDVSCISEKGQLERVKEIYSKNPEIQDKILYGSDFFLDLLFNDSFGQYKERMEAIFGKTIFDRLTMDNPAGFMARWY